MAVTKIKYIRNNFKCTLEYVKDKNKTDLKNSILYIDNEVKNEGRYITGINCSPKVADIQFKQLKNNFDKKEGILAYHVVQSFKPNEVTPQQAHKLGKELVDKMLQNKHQVLISTHIDKAHIHNHIIYNSVGLDGKKWHNDKDKYKYQVVRRYSDEVCKEHGLSIIKKETGKALSYKEWLEQHGGGSWKQTIRADIDIVIKESNTFEQFKQKLKDMGYAIKENKYIAFRPQTKQRYARGKTLGPDYTEKSIKQRIRIRNLGYDTKIYTVKNSNYNTYKKRKFTKHKSLTMVNISLFLSIIKELQRRPHIYNYSKNDIKYNDALIRKLSKTISELKKEKIKNYKNIKDNIKEETKKIQVLKSEIKAKEREKKDTKHLYERYLEHSEKLIKYKNAENDINNIMKQIKKTNKKKEQDKQVNKEKPKNKNFFVR